MNFRTAGQMDRQYTILPYLNRQTNEFTRGLTDNRRTNRQMNIRTVGQMDRQYTILPLISTDGQMDRRTD